MNFLAHIYLSGQDSELMVGNFIADFVKGKQKDNFPEGIRKGIELHRKIDDYTDHHPLHENSRRILRKSQGKYAGVVADMLYDHFLAKYFSEFSHESLEDFTKDTYRIIREFYLLLPEAVKLFFPYMVEKNWLLSYQSLEGLNRALGGLSRRVSFENRMDVAIQDIKAYYADLEQDFRLFFPQLRIFVANQS